MKVFANTSRGFIPKRRITSKYRIIGICQRAINIITCAKEGASLINKQGLVKKNAHLFQHQGHINKWIQGSLKTMSEFVNTQVT